MMEKADERAEYRKKKYEKAVAKNRALQGDILAKKKEIEELEQHASELEYSKKE